MPETEAAPMTAPTAALSMLLLEEMFARDIPPGAGRRQFAVERATAGIDVDLHEPFLVALRMLPQPDRLAIRELCDEFARLNVEPGTKGKRDE